MFDVQKRVVFLCEGQTSPVLDEYVLFVVSIYFIFTCRLVPGSRKGKLLAPDRARRRRTRSRDSCTSPDVPSPPGIQNPPCCSPALVETEVARSASVARGIPDHLLHLSLRRGECSIWEQLCCCSDSVPRMLLPAFHYFHPPPHPPPPGRFPPETVSGPSIRWPRPQTPTRTQSRTAHPLRKYCRQHRSVFRIRKYVFRPFSRGDGVAVGGTGIAFALPAACWLALMLKLRLEFDAVAQLLQRSEDHHATAAATRRSGCRFGNRPRRRANRPVASAPNASETTAARGSLHHPRRGQPAMIGRYIC